jgi:hypothetical protein
MTASHLDGMQFNFRTTHVEYLAERVALRQDMAELFGDRLRSPTIVGQKVFTSSGSHHFSCGLTSDPMLGHVQFVQYSHLNLSGYYMYHQD